MHPVRAAPTGSAQKHRSPAKLGICSWALTRVNISPKWAVEQEVGNSEVSPVHLQTILQDGLPGG